MSRTRVVKNGEPGVSDIHWGWFAKAIVVALLGLSAAAVQRAFYISSKIDVLDVRTAAIELKADTANAAADAVKNELQKAKEDAARRHEDFMTKDEFYHYMAPEVGRGKERR